jgi:hypothetical protein
MYPVMFPIYIAEFEHKTEARTWKYQVIMDAHDSTVRDTGLPCTYDLNLMSRQQIVESAGHHHQSLYRRKSKQRGEIKHTDSQWPLRHQLLHEPCTLPTNNTLLDATIHDSKRWCPNNRRINI